MLNWKDDKCACAHLVSEGSSLNVIFYLPQTLATFSPFIKFFRFLHCVSYNFFIWDEIEFHEV